MKTLVREKTYICGDYQYINIYPVFAPSGNRKNRRYKPTSEQQKRLNDMYAKKRLAMLLETNFQGEGYSVTLTYVNETLPLTDEQAFKNISNYIRRIKYRCKKKGVSAPCAIWCTERSKAGRYHHHMLIKCGLSRDELEALWYYGRPKADNLYFTEKGLEGLSKYLPKEPIGKQRWHRTRNFKEPDELVNDNMSNNQARTISNTNITAEEIERFYPDYGVVKDSITHYFHEYSDIKYVSFKLYKKKSKYINTSLRLRI